MTACQHGRAWTVAWVVPRSCGLVAKKAMETRGKTRLVPVSRDVTSRESDSDPLRANRRIVHPLSNLTIAAVVAEGEPNHGGSQSGCNEETTTSTANLLSTMSTIKWGTKCVSGIACWKDLGAIVLPFRHSVPAYLSVLRRHRRRHVPSICVLLVPTPDQAQCVLGPRYYIASIELDEVFLFAFFSRGGSRAITGLVRSCNRERDGYEFDNVIYTISHVFQKNHVWQEFGHLAFVLLLQIENTITWFDFVKYLKYSVIKFWKISKKISKNTTLHA